jgi:hypothetical protein
LKNKNLVYLLFFLPLSVAFSQEEANFYFGFNEVFVSESLASLEQIFDVRFSYQDQVLKDKTLTLKESDWTLDQVLKEISVLTSLSFQKVDERYIIVYESKATKKKTYNYWTMSLSLNT